MADMSRFHPKSAVYGEVIRIEKQEGVKNGKEWCRTDITLAQRVEGRWDYDAKEFTVFDNYVVIQLHKTIEEYAARAHKWELDNKKEFATAEELVEFINGLRARDIESGAPGMEMKVYGWVSANSWMGTDDHGKPVKKTASTPVVKSPEIDWAWLRETEKKAQKALAESRAAAKAAAPVAATVAAPATLELDDDVVF